MSQKVTVDDMVQAIRQAGKPVTAREIAEACGVTRQAISNYRDELEQDQRIEQGKVGTATAYWVADPLSRAAGGLDDALGGSRADEDTAGGGPPGNDRVTDVDTESREKADITEPETRTTGLLERLARTRMVLFSVLFLVLGLAFLPLGVSMIASGAVAPGAVMVGLSFLTLLAGAGILGTAVVAQLALARPLTGLVSGPMDGETA